MAIFARYAYAGGAEVIAVLLLRFVIAAALMTCFMLATRRRWPRGRNLLLLLGMGGVLYVGQSMSFFSALNHASAGLVALLLYLYPFLVTLLGALFLRQPLGVGRVVAVLAALFGTALTLGGGLAGEAVGVMLGVAAALIYSVYILAGGRVLTQEDPLAAATVVMIGAAAVFSALAIWQQPAFLRASRPGRRWSRSRWCAPSWRCSASSSAFAIWARPTRRPCPRSSPSSRSRWRRCS